jgi:hypothetical protein
MQRMREGRAWARGIDWQKRRARAQRRTLPSTDCAVGIGLPVGFDRIVVSEIETPNLSVNLT